MAVYGRQWLNSVVAPGAKVRTRGALSGQDARRLRCGRRYAREMRRQQRIQLLACFRMLRDEHVARRLRQRCGRVCERRTAARRDVALVAWIDRIECIELREVQGCARA